MPRTTKTEDFGKKIGGARKDLWASRGLLSSDLDELTDFEKKEYVNKNNIWKKPDYEAMLKDGRPREVIYFIKLVRDALPTNISLSYYRSSSLDEQYKAYIDFIQEIKNTVMDLKDIEGVEKLSDYLERTGKVVKSGYHRYSIADGYHSFITNKLLNVMNLYTSNLRYYQGKIRKNQFLYTEKDKAVCLYSVMKFDAATTNSYKQRGTYGADKDIVIWGTPCEIDGIANAGSRVGIPLPKEEAEQVLEKINDGEYFSCRNRRIVSITTDLKTAFDKCYEHYQETTTQKPDTPKKAAKRKQAYIPPQLRAIDRNGPVWRPLNRNVTGEKMLEDFKFRGGEFGNWLNETDRKQSLNFCYDALMDLSYALGLQPSNVSFNGTLAIAFGSRGRGGARSAVAHYEPAREVINLTKMKGAGSLGHEWIHAMDHAVASHFAGNSMNLATKAVYSVRKEVPEEFFKVMETIKSCKHYIAAAEELDKQYGADSQGYWASDSELLARAGACWIRDRLGALGIKNDYLVGHSEGQQISPHGEERERINLAFNNWLDKAKEIGFFSPEYLLPKREQDMTINLDMPVSDEPDRVYDPSITYTQLSLFDLPEITTPEVSEDEVEI